MTGCFIDCLDVIIESGFVSSTAFSIVPPLHK